MCHCCACETLQCVSLLCVWGAAGFPVVYIHLLRCVFLPHDPHLAVPTIAFSCHLRSVACLLVSCIASLRFSHVACPHFLRGTWPHLSRVTTLLLSRGASHFNLWCMLFLGISGVCVQAPVAGATTRLRSCRCARCTRHVHRCCALSKSFSLRCYCVASVEHRFSRCTPVPLACPPSALANASRVLTRYL